MISILRDQPVSLMHGHFEGRKSRGNDMPIDYPVGRIQDMRIFAPEGTSFAAGVSSLDPALRVY